MFTEFDIIGLFKKNNKKNGNTELTLGIGDDAAIFKKSGKEEWGITQDLLLEDTHFKLEWISPQDLAYKSIAVNLSDLAAMAATPRFLLLSLGVPASLSDSFIRSFATAFLKTCEREGVALIGGDTCESSQGLSIHVTAIGSAIKNSILYRTGANAGDLIYVSGPLGASSLGLEGLKRNGESALKKRHHRPPIRTQFAIDLGQSHLASAMTDISDGLLIDLDTLCTNQLSAKLHLDKIPIDVATRREAARLKLNPLPFALGGGEDYELLFTVPKKSNLAFIKWCKKASHRVFCIGEMLPSSREKISLFDAHGTQIPLRHFSKGYVGRG